MNSRLVGVALHLPALALLVVMDALVKRLAARYAVPQPMWARLPFQPAARPVQPAVLLRPGARPAGRRDRGRLRFAGADRGLGRGVVGWACRVAALGTGLLGVMVALRPSPSPAGAAARAMVPPLGTAMLFAVCQIPTRELVAVDDPHTAILHTSSATAGATSLAQPLFWTAPPPGVVAGEPRPPSPARRPASRRR